jgi:MFS family permease
MAKYGDYGTARQRDEYGGINWGASFFGWLVAVGIAALLTALLSAAGAAIAISEIENAGEAAGSADTVGIVGGLLILVVALIAYFAGGYVAGRMSRFDGGRQGLGVWIWGIVVAIVLAILGAIAGSEWNLFAGLELPRIPVDEGDLTTGGVIVLVIVLIGTLLAAMAGGKAGERYHRKVDELGHRPVAGREDYRDRDSVVEERAERRARRDRGDTSTAHS